MAAEYVGAHSYAIISVVNPDGFLFGYCGLEITCSGGERTWNRCPSNEIRSLLIRLSLERMYSAGVMVTKEHILSKL